MLIILILSQLVWAQEPLLEGVWSQDCQSQAQRLESFYGHQVALDEHYFGDPECTYQMLSFRSEGHFSAVQGKIDFSFQNIFITPHDPQLAADFNARKVCQIEQWHAGAEQNVTGKLCELFGPGSGVQIPPEGQMRYGIYKIEDERLYFGRLTPEHDALSPERRPQEYDRRFFKRLSK